MKIKCDVPKCNKEYFFVVKLYDLRTVAEKATHELRMCAFHTHQTVKFAMTQTPEKDDKDD